MKNFDGVEVDPIFLEPLTDYDGNRQSNKSILMTSNILQISTVKSKRKWLLWHDRQLPLEQNTQQQLKKIQLVFSHVTANVMS